MYAFTLESTLLFPWRVGNSTTQRGHDQHPLSIPIYRHDLWFGKVTVGGIWVPALYCVIAPNLKALERAVFVAARLEFFEGASFVEEI